MSHRGKRRARRGSSLKRQPMSLGSPSVHLDDSEQQDVAQLLGIQDGYRPVLPGDMEGEIPLHNPYGRAGMAQMGYLPESQLGQRMQGHVEHLDDSQHSAGPDDSDTSAEEDCIGATQDTADPQPTDPAPGDHLLPRQVRTISTDSEGNEVIEVFTIRDSHRLPGVPAGKRIIMEYNAACQPVGVSSMRFKRMAGDIVRSSNYVRIPDDWLKVPQRTKEDIWDALMAYFFVPPEFNLKAIKNEAFKDMGSKLRTWRYELKKCCAITEEDTPDTIRARVGEKTLDEYNAEDVEILLERWCTRQNKDYANKMKSLRALNKEPHCTGSKSYARATDEEAIRLGKYPTRAESNISTHTKADKSYPNEIVEERCKRMKELIPTDPAASSSITEGTVKWAPNDAYAQAHGNKPEYAGRVRQLGSGILPVRGSIRSYYTPSQARSENTSQYSMISQETLDRALEAERAKHKEEIDALVAENNARQAAFDARLRQIEAMMRFSSAPDGASPHIAVVPSSIDGEAGDGEDAMNVNNQH
ncbi:uncharacterized protein LOC132167849 [Corylus avellana]|uniref:uncharacterized protein LOC132167849 n=1 Tax=Corylus avellana TaxID=13451 RepID=UPI00286D61B7|nr:uncharacterized protein LOC132167849 [Corylus avellana]